VYWGQQNKGSRINLIVSGTGASISITGVKDDSHNSINEVDPDLGIYGLNYLLTIDGIGKVI
jgi:hypothetical protein